MNFIPFYLLELLYSEGENYLLMNAIIYVPNQKPYVVSLNSDMKLHVNELIGKELTFQPLSIQSLDCFQLIINDQAILNRLPKNRRISQLNNEYQMIRGEFILIQLDENQNPVSMDQEHINYMLKNDFEWATADDKDLLVSVHSYI